ncbi:dUTP diphosphatase [uncultured Phascolarctobacterium sp.]|jgi:dUTP pyrophosphatase|uniref:dUTP diphosphatase n=1 Tax=Caudovirales sp. ctIZM3 TaxID=2827633 RepID=A0A8S5T8T7_9CAUD|nr:dUTP diphosphatase [uncultured Phascolarctobacterium sp.]DAF59435.1 MAG TPA: dUTPase [Caudovirales sp. ctIZM3]
MPRKTTTTLKMGVKLVNDCAKLPKKASEGAACYDIVLPDDVYIAPHATKLVGTGIALNIPQGYRVDVFLRSSIAAKTMIRLANSVGKIDCDYTGEVKLLLENTGGVPARFYRGERVAQFEINKVTEVDLEEVDAVKVTERAAGGFGSTGK